jgi:hypothetical protein
LKNPYLKYPYINDNSPHIENPYLKKSPHTPMLKTFTWVFFLGLPGSDAQQTANTSLTVTCVLL